MITLKYPHKLKECKKILQKKEISTIDVISLQGILFGSENISTGQSNQRHKSYDPETVQKILKFQIEKNLSNVQLARHFKMSRNTVGTWKKLFKVEI